MKRATFVTMLSITMFGGFAEIGSAQNGQAAKSTSPEPSLVSISAGALIVKKPAEYSGGWAAFYMLDENPHTGWATPKGTITNQVTVIELPEKTQLKRLEFDIAGVDGAHRGAKDVDVEMSDTSAESGFQKIASVTLKDGLDRQSFPVSANAPGRWVRLTVKDNQGASDYIELMDFRGYGTQLTHTPFLNVSGTYKTNYGNMHLLQQGTSVTGCYEHAGGLLIGGVEGRIMRFTWTQDGNSGGPAVMVFSPDGKDLYGLWWNKGEDQTKSTGGLWNGPKLSTTVGTCPNWKGTGTEDQITDDLVQSGRSRIYGINFDSDSDHIKDESKPTLDKIAAMLKAKPDWKLTIEGHTDSTAAAAYNQTLSERRAAAVKVYLVAAGIDGARLTTAGFGASRPVATNDTALGRSQNRRVELTKN